MGGNLWVILSKISSQVEGEKKQEDKNSKAGFKFEFNKSYEGNKKEYRENGVSQGYCFVLRIHQCDSDNSDGDKNKGDYC